MPGRGRLTKCIRGNFDGPGRARGSGEPPSTGTAGDHCGVVALPPDTSPTAAFRHVRRVQEGEAVGAVAAAGLRRRPPARRPRRLRVAWVAAAAADLLGRPGVWTAWDPSQGTTPRPRNLGCIGASHESWDAQTALNDLTAALAADRV